MVFAAKKRASVGAHQSRAYDGVRHAELHIDRWRKLGTATNAPLISEGASVLDDRRRVLG
jgi:hypothetical protein